MTKRGIQYVARCAVTSLFMASALMGTGVFTPLAQLAHAEEAASVDELGEDLLSQADTVVDASQDGSEALSDEAGLTSEADETDVAFSSVAEYPSEEAEAASDEAVPADTDSGSISLSRESLTPGAGYDAKEYLDAFQIPVVSYSTTQPERGQYPFKNAFDGDWNTTYMAQGTPQQGTYTINFEKVEEVSRILYRHFSLVSQSGFPTHFKIYVSETGEEGSYREVVDHVTPEGQRPNNPITYMLSEPVKAKSIKFETLTSPGGMVAAEFKFLRPDTVADEMDQLFTDESRTQVADKYATTEALDELQQRVEKHPSKENMLGYIERARMILNGTWTLNTSFSRTTIKSGEGYDSAEYLAQYQVPVDVEGSSTSNPGSKGNELAKAFDGNWDTRYFSTNTVATTVTMKLTRETKIHRILYATGQGSDYGYPTKLKISFSNTGREGSFREVNAAFGATSNKVMLTLSEPVTATYVRFSFDGIYGGFNGFRYCASEIKVLGFDQVAYDVNDLFEDADTQYTLKDQYNSEEWLADLQARVDAHPYKESFAKAMARAWKVYRGELKTEENNDRLDWPVHVIQKTGDDSERIVYVMLAEGYRADEMDKFKADVTERIQDMLDLEPYRSMAPYMNIYAYCAESNESGYSSPTKTRDTFFKAYFRDSGVNGGVNQNRANLARNWIQNNYLDEGGKIMHATALINTEVYFGQGNGTSAASLSAGFKMTAHEGAHMYATLVDHYTFANIIRADNGGTNQTVNGDWKTIRWHEFLGHRGTGIYGSNGQYNPTTNCLMNSYYTDRFCEVCRECIFRYLNNQLKTKNPMYVAQPEITIKRTDEEIANGTGTGVAATDNAGSAAEWQSGPVVGESNITKANGRQLQYRTVVSNYLDTNQDVTLSFKITGADGTVKYEGEKTFSVHPNTQVSFEGLYPTIGSKPVSTTSDIRMAGAMSLTLVTDELNDLAEGDKIDAKVTYNGQLMGTDDRISYGTAKIAYKLVDDAGNEVGDMEEMGEQKLRVLTGTNTLPDVPEVYGYTYVKSSIDEDAWTAEEGKTSEIVRYYRASSVTVTRRLVDVNGLTISEKSSRVAKGETVTPAKSDFSVAEGYVIEAPAAVTVGSEDIVLTYTVRKGSDVTNAALDSTVKAYNPDGTAAFERPNRPMSVAVDSKKTDVNSYADFNNSSGSAASYAEFDLGGTYELAGEGDDATKDVVRLWRYWGDGRTYTHLQEHGDRGL